MVLLGEQGEYKQEMEWSSQHKAQIQTVTKPLKLGEKHPFLSLCSANLMALVDGFTMIKYLFILNIKYFL